MIDFHSHILPAVDDGSGAVEESLAMLEMQARQGIRTVVATPHFNARYDSPEAFLQRRRQAWENLRAAMKEEHLPQVILGAEVAFFRGMSHSEFLPCLTIGGGKAILIEMPPAPWPEEFYRELEEIWELRRILPVIAHIDRYIAPWRTFGIPERLAGMQVAVQANGTFFLERRTWPMAMRMLKNGRIQLLGSDCHNTTDRRPNLGPALARIRQRLGDDAVERIRNYGRLILSARQDAQKRMEW